MNREAIFHNPVSNYAFPISYEKFKVRLRAGKGDLDRVTLVIGNKYLWHTRKEVPMEVEGSDELFDYYSYVYPVDDPRVAYYFLLEKGDEQWLYGDSGFAKPELVNIDEDESSAFVNFHFPFINRIDIHKKPSWVNSAVFYSGFRYIYNRKKVLFIAPINDYRRIQINAFPCADNRKQVEGRVIFFSSFHKAWFVWVIDFVFHCPQ